MTNNPTPQHWLDVERQQFNNWCEVAVMEAPLTEPERRLAYLEWKVGAWVKWLDVMPRRRPTPRKHLD